MGECFFHVNHHLLSFTTDGFAFRYTKTMKVLLQRVSKGKVDVDGQTIGEIGKGVLLFVGITHEDTQEDADTLVDKILGLRIFENDEGKYFDKSVVDAGGEILVVSQFTLYARTDKGRRPAFSDAAPPEQANTLYEYFVQQCREKSELKVATGQFQAHMMVDFINDGPVTIMLES